MAVAEAELLPGKSGSKLPHSKALRAHQPLAADKRVPEKLKSGRGRRRWGEQKLVRNRATMLLLKGRYKGIK